MFREGNNGEEVLKPCESPFRDHTFLNSSKDHRNREEQKLPNDLDMPGEEYEKYKQEVLNDLKHEKEKQQNNQGINLEEDIKQFFDFSRDLDHPSSPHPDPQNTSREEDEAVEIGDMSGINNDMEDVKELKRLLYLAKMKIRKHNGQPDQVPPKSFKIKRRVKPTHNPRKIKTGYAKKRAKPSRDRKFARDNLFSYEYPNRGGLTTEHTKRNKMSIEQLHRHSMFKNNEYILQVENLSHKGHQASIENERRATFYGQFGPAAGHGVLGNNVAMNQEGFMTDNFKSRRSLVRCSSTNFHQDYAAMPPSNLPSNRHGIHIPKRGKTSQASRPKRRMQNKLKREAEMVQSTISIEGMKKSINPHGEHIHTESRQKRIGTAQAENRANRLNFKPLANREELSIARKTITEKWVDLDTKKNQHANDLKRLQSEPLINLIPKIGSKNPSKNDYQQHGFMYKRSIGSTKSKKYLKDKNLKIMTKANALGSQNQHFNDYSLKPPSAGKSFKPIFIGGDVGKRRSKLLSSKAKRVNMF